MSEKDRASKFKNCFSKCWNEEYPGNRAEIDRQSRKRGEWTKFMLGKYSKELKGPENTFLKRVCDNFIQNAIQNPKLEYWLEWYTVDACIVEKDRGEAGSEWCLKSHWHVILEHENETMLEEEMWKLLHFKAPLKVLIAYDYFDDEKEQDESKKNWLDGPDGKIKQLNDMNRSAYAVHPESDDTEYLLIVGNRKKRAWKDGDEEGALRWRFWRATPNTDFQEITDNDDKDVAGATAG